MEEKLESLKEENSQQLEELQEEKNEVLAKMAALKKILYGKFGDSINLEEDWFLVNEIFLPVDRLTIAVNCTQTP